MMDRQECAVMNPVAETQVGKFATAGRLADWNGKRIGLFWNGKPNGDVFLDEVARELRSRFQGLETLKIWEARPETKTVYGNSAENLEYIAQSADFVISASGD
jgi:hypothetical protein